uniref:Uncharacterized protein n=1 Tax=Lepeophtheirus salmonis TaxID=72036 RepID=A0A0K2TYZ9_LEPSM
MRSCPRATFSSCVQLSDPGSRPWWQQRPAISRNNFVIIIFFE